MTALIGWGGTADLLIRGYMIRHLILTHSMQRWRKIRDANPEAFRNIVGRMLEAHGRAFGNQRDEVEKLRNCMN